MNEQERTTNNMGARQMETAIKTIEENTSLMALMYENIREGKEVELCEEIIEELHKQTSAAKKELVQYGIFAV